MVDKILSEVYGCINEARNFFDNSFEESILHSSNMSECDQCNSKFNFLRRKHKCIGCGLNYCSTCAKRSGVGMRRCKKCEIFALWPIDMEQIQILRIRDLRHFLNSSNISTNGCTEKQDLIELVIAQLKLRYYNANHNDDNSSSQRVLHGASVPVVTRDDGIRVRATVLVPDVEVEISSNDENVHIHTQPSHTNLSSASSTHVYPPSNTRECLVRENQPSCPALNNLESDMPSDLQDRIHNLDNTLLSSVTSSITSSSSSSSSSESSSPVLNSSPLSSINVNDELLRTSSSSWSLIHADISCEIGGDVDPASFWEDENHSEQVEETSNLQGSEGVAEAQAMESNLSDSPVHTQTNLQEACTSEKPSIPVSLSNIVKLRTIQNEEEIKHFSVRQCKELLALHRADFSAVREKHELVEKVVMLWKDYQETHKGIADLAEDALCKICMDAPMDCVLLECGHILSCVNCGKRLAECPVCRQNVIRVVRTFKA